MFKTMINAFGTCLKHFDKNVKLKIFDNCVLSKQLKKEKDKWVIKSQS